MVPSIGIDTVLVNGVVVWQDGQASGHRPGRVLRREVAPALEGQTA
jgi:N-acyl-D-amino-acid deacylase